MQNIFVYMEILSEFDTNQIVGKVCRVKKSLNVLKQSPRSWFVRFRKALIDMSYQQINADHIVFFQQHGGYITMLAMYVDDMIITEDDKGEIAQLKAKLGKKFKVKNMGQLRYFFEIEVVCEAEKIILFQRKCVLDLLSEIGMLGCKPAIFFN
jgi:Reverse transcriptase (RNA-dependent DNA polymerase)